VLLDDLRAVCATIADRSSSVRIEHARLAAYARALVPAVAAQLAAPPDPEAELLTGDREARASFWLCLDAINFGSGWFPTLRKRPGRSGYFAVAIGVRERFVRDGAMDVATLSGIQAPGVAAMLGQDPSHPLMALFAAALRDVGHHVGSEHEGSFAAVVDTAAQRAVALVDRLAAWDAFADTSSFQEMWVPFLKRAQITAADLHRSGVAAFIDLEQLTLFADNLVPHVLRVDGMLSYDPALQERIKRGDRLEHGSPDEVAIRACAVHAVELLCAELPGTRACDLDLTLWNRGQAARYRAVPRHRTRCTAY